MTKDLANLINRDAKNEWMPDKIMIESYHSMTDSISSSQLKPILKSPAKFLTALDEIKEPSPAMRFGNIADQAILEPDLFEVKHIIMPDFGDLRSSKNRAAKAEWLEQHKDRTSLSQNEYDSIRWMIDSIMNHREANLIFETCLEQQTGFFTDPDTGIRCRVRPDLICPEIGLIADMKTTQDCSMEAFQRIIWNLRYDFQMAFYQYGASMIDQSKYNDIVFIVVEREKPFDVAVYPAHHDLLKKGYADVRASLRKLETAIKTNTFAGYQSRSEPITLPRWAI